MSSIGIFDYSSSTSIAEKLRWHHTQALIKISLSQINSGIVLYFKCAYTGVYKERYELFPLPFVSSVHCKPVWKSSQNNTSKDDGN